MYTKFHMDYHFLRIADDLRNSVDNYINIIDSVTGEHGNTANLRTALAVINFSA